MKIRSDNEAVFVHDTLRIKYHVPVRITQAVPTPDYFCYMIEPETGFPLKAAEIERVLRFFRFYAWFGRPPLDGAGFAACRRNAATLG